MTATVRSPGAAAGEARRCGTARPVAYPTRGGYGEILEALAGRLAHLQLGRYVERIDPQGRRVTLRDGETLRWGCLVSTIPLLRLPSVTDGVPRAPRGRGPPRGRSRWPWCSPSWGTPSTHRPARLHRRRRPPGPRDRGEPQLVRPPPLPASPRHHCRGVAASRAVAPRPRPGAERGAVPGGHGTRQGPWRGASHAGHRRRRRLSGPHPRPPPDRRVDQGLARGPGDIHGQPLRRSGPTSTRTKPSARRPGPGPRRRASYTEKPVHPGNVFWRQSELTDGVLDLFDGRPCAGGR